MKRLIPLLFLATTASASYSGYQYQSVITVSSTNVSNVLGTLNNFPVLVSTNDISISTTSGSGGQLHSTGMDLIFSTMSDCSFLLHWDTETVQNVGVSTFNAWVNVPVLTTATLTAATFYMCYGNSGITTYQGYSTATWDSNYLGVWHVPNGSTLTTNDSTGNRNNGTIGGSGITATAGQIDGAAAFTGANTISGGGASVSGSSFTLENWFYLNNSNNVHFSGIGTTHAADQAIQLGTNVSDAYIWWSAFSDDNSIPVTMSTNTWYHVAATVNASKVWIVYFNGASAGTSNFSNQPTPNSTWTMGGDGLGTNMVGNVDEMRISNSVRSSDWISTEYKNQSSPSTFLTVSAGVANFVPPVSFTRGLDVQGGRLSIRGGKMGMQ